MGEPKKSASLLGYVIIPGLLITIFAALLNVFIYNRELTFLRNVYNNEVAGMTSLIGRRFQTAVIAAGSTAALFVSSNDVTEDEFNLFGSILTTSISSGPIAVPLTVEWVDAQNMIRYVYPMNEDNAKIVGLDLNKNPNRLLPITKAKETRLPVVTEPLMLGQGYPGLILYSPIYKGSKYLGEAVVVVRLANLLAPIPGSSPVYHKDEYIQTGNFIIPFDDDMIFNNKGDRIINPQGDAVQEPISAEYSPTKAGVVSESMVFADKTWQIRRSPTYIAEVDARMSIYGGISFVFITAIISFLWVIYKRREQLAASAARIEALVLSIGDGLVACDKDGIITFINKKAEEFSGYDAEESIGKAYYDVWHLVDGEGADIPAEKGPLYHALTHKETVTISIESHLFILKKNGSRFPVASTIAPIMIGENIGGAIIVFRDITKESEVDRMKTEFLSLASHQLRTPITAISWNLEMLLGGDRGRLTKEQKAVLTEMHESSKNMTELVNGFLDVTKIEAGGFVLERGDVDLLKTTDLALQELTAQITDKKIKVVKTYGDNISHLDIGTKTASIIMQNLLTNAIKYTRVNGIVEIKIEMQDKNISISVKDNGYGIPEEAKSRIFTRLFRADNIRQKEPNGTGLGLYLLKSLTDKLGGKVWFESTENVGTVFYVSLPIASSSTGV